MSGKNESNIRYVPAFLNSCGYPTLGNADAGMTGVVRVLIVATPPPALNVTRVRPTPVYWAQPQLGSCGVPQVASAEAFCSDLNHTTMPPSGLPTGISHNAGG